MEIWDAYYPNGELVGKDLIRGEEIPKEYRHGVAEVFVMHNDGSILLMQRDWNKESYPGKYESGAGGSLLKGENFIEGAKRELREETGIICSKLEEVYSIVTDKEIIKGYLCITDVNKDKITLQKGETISYKWISREEFLLSYKTDEFCSAIRNIEMSNRLK